MDNLENACNTVINTLYKNPEVLGTEITNGIVFDLLYIRNNASSFKTKTKGEK